MASKQDVYVCATPFAAAGGIAVARGTRLRGDNRLVREYGRYWVLDGTPEEEWPRPTIRFEEPEPPRFKRREIPVARQVRAVRSFTAFLKGRHHVVQRGQMFDRKDAIVKKLPEEFETIPQQLDEAAVA